MPVLPYRIETDRLVLRCWDPRDAPRLQAAIDASLDHLRPWIPWAYREPQSVDEKLEVLRGYRSSFDADSDYGYGVFTPDEREVVGGVGLYGRAGEGAFEVGYWIAVGAVGQGLAAESVAAVTRAGFDHGGAERLELRIDPRNGPSCRLARRLGYVEEGRLRRGLRPLAPGGSRADGLVFSLLSEEFDASPAAALSAEMAAFDAIGRRL